MNKIAKLLLIGIVFSLVPFKASSDNFLITPSLWEDRLVETSFQTVMSLENKEDSERIYSVVPASFRDTPSCGLDYDTEYPPALAVDRNEIALSPGEKTDIAITGSYDPEKTDGFYGALLLSDITDEISGTEGITSKARIAATFRMRGQKPWDISVVPEIAQVNQSGTSAIQYTLKLRNNGKVDVFVGGTVEAVINGVTVREQLSEKRIYPGLCGFVSSIFEYDNIEEESITFNAFPVVQSAETGTPDNEIFDIEGLEVSKSVEIENNGLADKRFELNVFNVIQVQEEEGEAILVQYRIENVGKLTGNPTVNIAVAEPGSRSDVSGKSYQAIRPGESAEGETLFYVEEGVYDIEISLYEASSVYDKQTKRLSILGEGSNFDARFLLLIIPIVFLIYLVSEQRKKIKELEKK